MKVTSDFHKQPTNKDGIQGKCKKCRSEEASSSYRGKRNKYECELKELLGGEFRCRKCDYTSKCWAPFDLHHINMEKKEFIISTKTAFNLDKVRDEIGKC